MIIGNFGLGGRPMVVAEIGAAHNGSLDTALELVSRAKGAGADAVKVQVFLPDTITRNINRPEFVIQKGPWKGRHLHDLYTQAHMPRDWFEPIFERGARDDIMVFPSVFSIEDLQFVRQFEPPAYKIASFELVDSALVKETSDEGKPMVLSTGMASFSEVNEAVRRCRWQNRVILLHCISSYPTEVERANLCFMDELRRLMPPGQSMVGLSDHTFGNEVAMMAVARGACLIEKHITLSPGGGGLDDGFATGVDEFGDFVKAVHRAYAAVGDRTAARDDSEHAMLRRSLYVVEDVMEGHLFSTLNVASIRPGLGLAPRFMSHVFGAKAAMDIPAGTPLGEHHIVGGLE